MNKTQTPRPRHKNCLGRAVLRQDSVSSLNIKAISESRYRESVTWNAAHGQTYAGTRHYALAVIEVGNLCVGGTAVLCQLHWQLPLKQSIVLCHGWQYRQPLLSQSVSIIVHLCQTPSPSSSSTRTVHSFEPQCRTRATYNRPDGQSSEYTTLPSYSSAKWFQLLSKVTDDRNLSTFWDVYPGD